MFSSIQSLKDKVFSLTHRKNKCMLEAEHEDSIDMLSMATAFMSVAIATLGFVHLSAGDSYFDF